MSAILHKEVQTINLKYGGTTIVPTFEHQTWSLFTPTSRCRLLLEVPASYPDSPPEIVGAEKDGESFSYAGEGRFSAKYGKFAHLAKMALDRVFVAGRPCLDMWITEIERLMLGMKA
jgi:hypothetical protein